MASSLDQQKQENEIFVYSVSHDLRSPLINLQGFSQELALACREVAALFERKGVPEDVKHLGHRLLQEDIEDSIRYIQSAVGRVARIIDALLRLSRAGRVDYLWQMIDVALVVQKVIDSLRDTVALKRAEVVVHELGPCWGDATAVEQVFANLIGNAVSYLDPARPGRIEVGCTDAAAAGAIAGFHTYSVKDNGLGIPVAYHGRVFRPFSRLQADVPQGEGVGLALVYRTVERLGGKIWMESAPGVGTMFFVAMAAAPPAGKSADNGARGFPLPEEREGRTSWQPNRS
jgi:signal transduction histidine kinase